MLRRNPERAVQMEAPRQDKFATLAGETERRNACLAEHPREPAITPGR